ncbi:MAG: hypothetical protein Q8934_09770 [Bacillota bacterium]|nr:hypothetical protein [Bacillota bacterium]
MAFEMKHVDQPPEENIEVWEELVNIKELVRTLLICSITILGCYFFAPKEPHKPLFFGLIGALIGFVLSQLIEKVK